MNPDNNTAEDPTIVTLPLVIDLAITKTHAEDFLAGEQGVYSIEVIAGGNTATSGPITVVDTLPAGFSYVSVLGSGWSCVAEGQVVTCVNESALAPGARSALELTVALSSTAISATNMATVSTDGDENLAKRHGPRSHHRFGFADCAGHRW